MSVIVVIADTEVEFQLFMSAIMGPVHSSNCFYTRLGPHNAVVPFQIRNIVIQDPCEADCLTLINANAIILINASLTPPAHLEQFINGLPVILVHEQDMSAFTTARVFKRTVQVNLANGRNCYCALQSAVYWSLAHGRLK